MTASLLPVVRGGHRLYAEVRPGTGVPIVLMHGFPDNLHLYDRLLPHLDGERPVVRFDFLGWGRSDKPAGYPYTADNQMLDLAAVLDAVSHHLGQNRVVLVAHDASGPPAIDWALRNPDRVAALVLLNTYYQWLPGMRRPPVIALFSTPGVNALARVLARRRPAVQGRLYAWQVGAFISDPTVRRELVPRLAQDFPPAQPAFFRLNEDLLGTLLRRRGRVAEMRRFTPPVRVVFGARDRYLNARVARRFADLFPNTELHLLPAARHYVQVDEPEHVGHLISTA
ncbi:alpha/beta fold hydrolase [Plantactinospora mayteni]|uniref:Haloalkane dehalogenase n=1 Tax=Plantactinospora mayteni TaxID=566021 RepID=A0ABQ4F1H2_9ACTN|nr:alpha/beta fold hydrolase [Plantactinospora mayteni]GIH00764.1 haloalkane dehalogenase [Plantactinospora mayteni]